MVLFRCHPDFFLSFNMRLYITCISLMAKCHDTSDQWVIGAHYQHYTYIPPKMWTYIHNMWIFVNISYYSYHNLWILLSIICESMSTLSDVYKSYIVSNNIYSDYYRRLWGRGILGFHFYEIRHDISQNREKTFQHNILFLLELNLKPNTLVDTWQKSMKLTYLFIHRKRLWGRDILGFHFYEIRHDIS